MWTRKENQWNQLSIPENEPLSPTCETHKPNTYREP